MKVKVLRSFCIENGGDSKIGEILEMSEREAKIKISQGKVAEVREHNKQLLYPDKEALQLIEAAETIAEVDDVITGDTRKKILAAAEARKKELANEPEKEAKGGI